MKTSELRSLAQTMKPLMTIGKGELDEEIVTALDKLLTARELVKIKVLDTQAMNVKDVASYLAFKTKSAVVQTIGHMIVLFRKRKENSRYES